MCVYLYITNIKKNISTYWSASCCLFDKWSLRKWEFWRNNFSAKINIGPESESENFEKTIFQQKINIGQESGLMGGSRWKLCVIWSKQPTILTDLYLQLFLRSARSSLTWDERSDFFKTFCWDEIWCVNSLFTQFVCLESLEEMCQFIRLCGYDYTIWLANIFEYSNTFVTLWYDYMIWLGPPSPCQKATWLHLSLWHLLLQSSPQLSDQNHILVFLLATNTL